MKELTVDDYDSLKPYLDKADYEGYNSNFVSMMMWKHEFHIEYEIHDHYAILLYHFRGNYFWAMPYTTKEYYEEAIDYMIDYSDTHHFEFVIENAIHDFVEDVREIYGKQLLYKRTPNNDDYLYTKNQLMTLSGKKMQKRRNHYNAFKKMNPDYEYRDLDPKKDYDTILAYLYHWYGEEPQKRDSLYSELYGILYLLNESDKLAFKVGALYINDCMEAFIIASELNHQTIEILVEKGNKRIRGIYPAITKEFLEHHYKEDNYVNREEDMGLDNLRKAKQEMKPLRMIEKTQIKLNHSYIDNASNDDLKGIKNLWLANFEDEDKKSTEFYFSHYYKKENTYVLKNDDEIISALQIVPYYLSINSKTEKGYFILGVCTDKNYQKQGCMKKLLLYVLDKYKDYRLYLQAYHPEIYIPFGFHTSHKQLKTKIDKDYYNFEKDVISYDYDVLKGLYDSYCYRFNEYRVRDNAYFNLLIQRCSVFDDQIMVFKSLDNYDGYMIVHQSNNDLYISECIYKDHDALDRMISTLSDKYDEITIISDLKADIKGASEEIIQMMSNSDTGIAMNDKYINEVY